jgi:peroxiredoxin
MKRHSVLSIIAAGIICLCIPCCTSPSFATTIPTDSRKAAPDFTLPDANGVSFKLSQFNGKVVLLNFWATWCHGCKTEIPWYVEFQSKYKDEGLTVVGVSMDEDWKAVRPFLAEHNVKYVVGVGNDALSKQYNVSSMPVSLLIDRQGRIAESHVGVVDISAFEEDVRKLLNENASPSGTLR